MIPPTPPDDGEVVAKAVELAIGVAPGLVVCLADFDVENDEVVGEAEVNNRTPVGGNGS